MATLFWSFSLSVSSFLYVESWFSGKESANGRNGFGILENAKNCILHKNTLFALSHIPKFMSRNNDSKAH